MAPSSSATVQRTYFQSVFDQLCVHHFHVLPHEWQSRVGGLLMQHSDRNQPCRMLCIQPTGSGKSLLYQTLCTYFKGVALYISPLLTLGADQVNKLMAKTQILGSSVIPISLDSFSHQADVDEVAALVGTMCPETTAVIFASPQTITDKFPRFVSEIKLYIKFIIIDEIHIFNSFGRSFRSEFQKLKTRLFKAVNSKVPMLFLTATCTERIKDSFESMIGVQVTHVDWPPQSHSNRRVSLFVNYSSKPFAKVSSELSSLIKRGIDQNKPTKCIVYSNIRKKVLELKDKIGETFDADESLHSHDIVAVHGNLSKFEKEKYIQMFLDPEHSKDKLISVMCATSGVANVGLDSKYIRAVFRVDYPTSILDIVQESGRAGRVAIPSPESYSYHLSFCLEGFLFLYERAMNPDEQCLDPSYRLDEVKGMIEVGRVLLLRKRCMYVEIERYLSNPSSTQENFVMSDCGICPYCRNDDRIIPIISKNGTRRVFFQVYNPSVGQRVVAASEVISEVMTIDVLVNLIRNFPCEEGVSEIITGRGRKDGLRPDTIKRIIFAFVLTGILDLAYHSGKKEAFYRHYPLRKLMLHDQTRCQKSDVLPLPVVSRHL